MIKTTEQLENDLRGIDWSSNGEYIVAGDMKGKIILFDANLNQLDAKQSSFTKKDQWIEDIKFSPDSSLIAFGAHGGCSPIELFKVSNKKLAKDVKVVLFS
jgi:WD40 repeat protein